MPSTTCEVSERRLGRSRCTASTASEGMGRPVVHGHSSVHSLSRIDGTSRHTDCTWGVLMSVRIKLTSEPNPHWNYPNPRLQKNSDLFAARLLGLTPAERSTRQLPPTRTGSGLPETLPEHRQSRREPHLDCREMTLSRAHCAVISASIFRTFTTILHMMKHLIRLRVDLFHVFSK